MKVKEKTSAEVIADVVGVILREVELRPKSDRIPIFFEDPIIKYLDINHLLKILEKLKNDHGVIKTIVSTSSSDNGKNIKQKTNSIENFNGLFIEIEESFEKWANNYISKNMLQDKLGSMAKEIYFKPNESDRSLVIELTTKREIVLNKLFVLSKPNFGSENEMLFSLLYENPNETHQKVDLEKQIGTSLTKGFHKIVENLGFGPDLKKCFFDVGKNSIIFYNPVTKERLDKLKIEYISR